MLYIIRHGKTDWNEKHKIQGQIDIPLNEVGRKMAENASERYKDVHFDVCYCSTLKRARETADLLLKGRDIPIFYDDRLREFGFGIYEGTENSFSIPGCPVNEFFFHPEEYKVPVEGGESLDGLFKRTGEFLREVAFPLIREGKDVLIVGHGAMNSCIICQIKYGSDRTKFWKDGIPNCELMKLDVKI
ncbi:MAG: histidine phosphatase family protein [Lachnospiraceae bacterium]|nr:histidine phosphatase family protein [Lachnospiraceae bacterium]